MATRLKETDVVIIGLGAAGGVAALPLAQAGLDIVGLEAGTWLTRRDFAPDELRNNFRGWPQAVQKANHEVPDTSVECHAPNRRVSLMHPMMNAVGGTSLHYWAQSWRLNPWDFKVVSETTRRYGRVAHPERLDGRRLAVWLSRSSSRPTTRSSTRSECPARPGTSAERSIPAATCSKDRASGSIRCRRCAAADSLI